MVGYGGRSSGRFVFRPEEICQMLHAVLGVRLRTSLSSSTSSPVIVLFSTTGEVVVVSTWTIFLREFIPRILFEEKRLPSVLRDLHEN